VREAAQAGLRDFGENYVQEASKRSASSLRSGLTWHYIGPIQSNKTRAIRGALRLGPLDRRAKIAARLAQARGPGQTELQAASSVNVSGEATRAASPLREAAHLGSRWGRCRAFKLPRAHDGARADAR